MESIGILWNPLESFGILWNPLKSFERSQYLLKPITYLLLCIVIVVNVLVVLVAVLILGLFLCHLDDDNSILIPTRRISLCLDLSGFERGAVDIN